MKYTYHIQWIHCPSCKILIENILSEEPDVAWVSVEMKTSMMTIEVIDEKPTEEVIETLNKIIIPHGYTLSLEKLSQEKKQWKNLLPIIFGGLILLLFFYLQKSGILNIGIGGSVTPASSFMLWLVASVSSCLAIVWWLVLSLSAAVSRDKKSDTKNFILFHSWRIIWFAILGGLLGLLGESIGVNPLFASLLGIIAAIVMILLGFNLTGILTRSTLALPSSTFQRLKSLERKTFTPLIIWVGTFFLPCGFTQSMQVVALSSGSFLSGWIIMTAFVLGTFPMLAFLSFGATGFSQSRFSDVFFRTSGVVVIGLGLFSLLTGLASLWIIPPLFNL